MYNRILKRPMFKRGGSSYEAQGTGITSPYDMPRKRYDVGTTQEEINERRRNLFQPRSEMDFAAEGFSALGNPYNQRTGEAKTIGEMLYEGATGVRKSRAADKALGQSVDLANIQSDENRLLAEEKHARDLELAEAKENQLQKNYSVKRQVLTLTQQLNKLAENAAFPGAKFINDGNALSVARGTIEINENGYDAMVIPYSAMKKIDGIWKVDKTVLAANMVYWNPITQQWLIVKNARNKDSKKIIPIHYSSYQEAKAGLKVTDTQEEKKSTSDDSDSSEKEIKTNEIKTKILTNLKDVDLTDVVVNEEALKVGIKIVDKPEGSGPNWKINLADNEMSLVDFKAILKTKKFSDQTQHLRTNKKKKNTFDFEEIETTDVAENLAAGGRAGYALGNVVNQGEELDPATDDLNELTSWWKSEVNKSFNS